MSEYLLTIVEGVGTRYEATLKVLVRATDPGWAKSHWHRLQNNNGGVKQKQHYYSFDSIGYWSELQGVRELEEHEVEAAEDMNLPRIPGFQELDK